MLLFHTYLHSCEPGRLFLILIEHEVDLFGQREVCVVQLAEFEVLFVLLISNNLNLVSHYSLIVSKLIHSPPTKSQEHPLQVRPLHPSTPLESYLLPQSMTAFKTVTTADLLVLKT